MEWVVTTAKTLDEAKDAALDQLGVDEYDAEFEILEEPTKGLFGRVRGEARVRARVAPRVHRPKQERRRGGRSGGSRQGDRGGRKGGAKGGSAKTGGAKSAASDQPAGSERQSANGSSKGSSQGGGSGGSRKRGGKPKGPERASPAGSSEGSTDRARAKNTDTAPAGEGRQDMEDSVTVEEQAEIMEEFLVGLLDAFGVEGSVSWAKVDDDTVEIDVTGDDLGLLIGPKGSTLSSVQDLARTVAQRRASGHHEGRVRVDIGGYRQHRREALARFATQLAEQVQESGTAKALEPMNAADRKVVHDTVNEIDGVHTRSDGQDPDRWVVILPD